MKFNRFLIAVAACLLIGGPVYAGSISCGSRTFTDDQLEGQLSVEVLDQCGEPSSRDGDNWLYDRSDTGEGVYVLHFNSSNQLESIEQQLEE